MDHALEVLDLDYDSPLESVFGFLGSPWCMGFTSLVTWLICIIPRKIGRPPIWADFPVFPFCLGMLCLWAVGFWLQANYDVRYHLDSRTQQLDLVRKIFGQTFKSRVAEFSQLYSTAVMSACLEDKLGNRSWEYALCLITNSARIVRVSSFGPQAPTTKAAEISKNLGIANFPCQDGAGTLMASRGRDGEITLGYQPKAKAGSVSGLFVFLMIVVSVSAIIGVWLALSL